jgi:hypothetical protein
MFPLEALEVKARKDKRSNSRAISRLSWERVMHRIEENEPFRLRRQQSAKRGGGVDMIAFD